MTLRFAPQMNGRFEIEHRYTSFWLLDDNDDPIRGRISNRAISSLDSSVVTDRWGVAQLFERHRELIANAVNARFKNAGPDDERYQDQPRVTVDELE